MNAEQAECLVRTGAGTPMGNLMRRYWVPVMLSSEIAEPDGPQVRVKILGESLLAFRDSTGAPGLIDEFCAHRGASLFFGRNEECGIRCSYHGWKYDVTGACVELPQKPDLAGRMRITAYPCIEQAGVLWAYMGPPEHRPAPPRLEWSLLPESQRFVSKRLQECSYLQAMEGGIDTTHASWVHRYELDLDPMHKHAKANKYIRADGNAVFNIERTPSGLTIFGRRNGEADSYYWRITQWIFPWFTLIPPFGPHALGAHIWVPIDDENCWAWSINFDPAKPLDPEERAAMQAGKGIHVTYEPGSFRPLANRDNDYLIDRKAQKDKATFSGVEGFSLQDASLQESMGPIQNHARENLVPSDEPIALTRRLLYRAAQDLKDGIAPPALAPAEQSVRAASVLLDRNEKIADWAQENLHADPRHPVFTV
jgi:phthalate 4,5-dioxygenase oxygenase subunit